MARRGSARASAYRSPIATPRVHRRILARPPVPSPAVNLDRRTYHPLGPFRPLHASPRAAARVEVRQGRPFRFPDVFQFGVPDKVRLCVQRAERREVLFAKRKTGAGARSRKRRSFWSTVSCKR